jgi:hypothetical protein
MRLIKFQLSSLLLLHAVSTMSYAMDEAARGDEIDLLIAQESNEAMNAAGSSPDAQAQQNPGYIEGQTSPNTRGNQTQGNDQDQQSLMESQGGQQDPQRQPQTQDPTYQQRFLQGQGTQIQQREPQGQAPQYQEHQGTQTQGQQNPRSNQVQPNSPYNPDPSGPAQGQGQGTAPVPNTQGKRRQGTPGQLGVGQGQDQLPPEPPQVKLPKKPGFFPTPTPAPTPTPTPAAVPTFIPAPPPDPIPEPTTRPQSSGPKTAEQKSYESAMQTRWKTAADEIALLKSRGESLQGKKGKAFRESLRTASGNRSIARTKLNQLVRAPSADFDKLKTGVERAFTDLDNSIARVRSYFDEPPPP